MNTMHRPDRAHRRAYREPIADPYFCPELGSVHLLHEAVCVTIRTLDALHAYEPSCQKPAPTLARAILQLLRALDGLLGHYQLARNDELRTRENEEEDEDDSIF